MSQYKGFYSVKSIADAASHFENLQEVSHEKLIEFLQNWEAAQQNVQRIVRYACPNCGSESETYHSADCPANPHNR